MKIVIELFVALVCAYAVVLQLLRIIWLQFPGLLKNTRLYRIKEPRKIEMLFYFLITITALLYNILLTAEKYF